jgi:hypothetical protein
MKKLIKRLIREYGYPTLCVTEQELLNNLDKLMRLEEALRPFSRGRIQMVLKKDNSIELHCRGIKEGVRELPPQYIGEIEKFHPLKIVFEMQPMKEGVPSGLPVAYNCLLIRVKGGSENWMFFTR